MNYLESDKPLYRLQYVQETVNQWWQQFMSQNFSSLVPRQKWFTQKRNMTVGDVVLIHYVGKSKPGDYRLGIVVEAEKDSDNLVRTVTVEYSILPGLSEDQRSSYEGITKKRIRAPVQRLVLILPVEEQVDRDPVIKEVTDSASVAASQLASGYFRSSLLTKVFRQRLKSCSLLDSELYCEDLDKGLYCDFARTFEIKLAECEDLVIKEER